MTYAEYRAHRLATADEPRVPSMWRIDHGRLMPNDRAARRRAMRRSEEMDRHQLSPKVILHLRLQLHWW